VPRYTRGGLTITSVPVADEPAFESLTSQDTSSHVVPRFRRAAPLTLPLAGSRFRLFECRRPYPQVEVWRLLLCGRRRPSHQPVGLPDRVTYGWSECGWFGRVLRVCGMRITAGQAGEPVWVEGPDGRRSWMSESTFGDVLSLG
jgi:hypothetical protein